MKTFEEQYCAAHKCPLDQFSRRIFWQCLHRHAILLAPLILIFNRRYFEADRELIVGIRRAEKMTQVWSEVREYFTSPKYQGWLRKKVNIRLSARRLINVARDYLPASGAPPSAFLEADRAEDRASS